MRAAATAAGGGKEGECGGSGAGAESADPRWRPSESERARAGSGRARRGLRAGEGGRAGLCRVRRSLAVRARLGAAVGATGTPELSSLLTHPAGPENCAPARSSTTATGADAFVARSGPPPSPPSAPPPLLSGLASARWGRAEAGWCERLPPLAALRFCGVFAAALSHDNELALVEGPGGRSAWRPAQASFWWGGAGGWRQGKGASKPGFPLSSLPAPDGGLLGKRVQARALPR